MKNIFFCKQNLIDLRYCQAGVTIYVMIVFSILMISCNVQDNNSNARDHDAGSNTVPGEPSANGLQLNNQDAEVPWVDPLFFVDGQFCQHLRKIFQDSKGNLWLGTNVYGLMLYNGDSLEFLAEYKRFDNGRITGIVEDSEGNVWFGQAGGLIKWDGNSFTNFTEEDGLVNNEIWSLKIDSKGIFWIGTTEGLSQFDGRKFTTVLVPKVSVRDTSTNYSYNRITCTLEDRNGTIWIGTDGFGIWKYNGNSFQHITTEDGLSDNCIGDLMEDSKGNIWIATMFGGISRYDGRVFTNFTQEGIVEGVEVGALFEDKAGDIWFAAENYGVYRYDGQSFTNLYTKEGLLTNGILCILEDREGRFWFGGWGGLFRYDGKSFVSVSKDGPWE